MFKIPRANVIESDEGFSVEVLGRTGLKYIQGDKILHVDSEVLMGHPDLMIAVSGIGNWDSGEPIKGKTKNQIIDNIISAYTWQGVELDLR